MYCKINPKLFKPFQSRNVKVIPKLSDDWKIIPEKYNSNDDITIYSEKLDTKIAGFKVYDFLKFLENYKVKMDGLKIQGEWIPGQDRKLYLKEDYEKWIEKYGKIVDGKIFLKDIDESKIGRKYLFKCGAEYYFLGFIEYKGKKVRLFGASNSLSYTFEIIRDNKKLSQELNEVLDKSQIELYFANFFVNHLYLINKKDIKTGEYVYEKWYDKDKGIVDNRFFNPLYNIQEIYDKKGSYEIRFDGFINRKYYSPYEMKYFIFHKQNEKINLDDIFDIEWKFKDNKFYYKFYEKRFLNYRGQKIKENKKVFQELIEKYCKDFRPFEFDIFYKKIIKI